MVTKTGRVLLLASTLTLGVGGGVVPAAAQPASPILHSTLDDLAAVLSPLVGTGDGASVNTSPPQDFVPAQVGSGVRINAPGEVVRFRQTDGVTTNLDPARGTLDIWYRPAYAHTDGNRYPIVSTGAWANPGSLHVIKDNGANDNALKVWVFNAAGAAHGESEFPATAYGWSANTWVQLRVTWDFGVSPGAPNVRLFVGGQEVPPVSVTTGPVTMPAPGTTRHLHLGGRGLADHANGILDEVMVYGTPVVPSPSDTTPPVVALTHPAPGTVVSGMTTLTASASDNVAVASVSFLVDGVALGAPITTPPYTITWDASGGGAHSLTAVATDTSGNQGASNPVNVTADDSGAPLGFFDHFAGPVLDPRWVALGHGAGTVQLTDGTVECRSPAPADACALYHAAKVDKRRSQLWVFAVANDGGSQPRRWLTLANSATAPTLDTQAVWSGRFRARIGTDQVGATAGITFEYWTGAQTRTFWNGGASTWTTAPGLASSPIAADDYLLVGLEIDGPGQRWRMLAWGRRSGSAGYDYDQGLRLSALSDWVGWSALAGTDDLWVVIGEPVTDADAGTLRVEWARLDAGPRHDAWANSNSLGGTYVTRHVWGYESPGGGVEVLVPEDRTSLAVGTQSTPGPVRDPYVLYDPADGVYYMVHSGHAGGFQIELATSPTANGTFTSFTGNPIIARVPLTDEHEVAVPALVKDLAEPDPSRRFKLLYLGVDNQDDASLSFRIFLATAPHPTGPWTRRGVALDKGPAGAFDQSGYSRPRPVFAGGQWVVFLSAKNNAEPGAPWRVTYATGPSLDSLTRSGVILVDRGTGPAVGVTAPVNGRLVSVTSTAGFTLDAYVEIAQDTNPDIWAASRVRKVIDATTLELYHGLDGFTPAPPATLVQVDGANAIEVSDVRPAGGRWHLYVTPFSFFGAFPALEVGFENSGLLTADALTGPYAWHHVATPPVTRGFWRNDVSNENVTFLHLPAAVTSVSTVAVTEPAAGATVSGTTTVKATASDTDGVAGVQFRLNDAPLGAEDTSAPYEVPWDTTTVTDGTHTLTAVLRDGLGNLTTSAGVTVTVNNVPVGGPFPLLETTLDGASAVSAPVHGTGTGASVSTSPANDFVAGHTGSGIRVDAAGEYVRFQQTAGGVHNVNLTRGTLDLWYRPAYAHTDGNRYGIASTGTWASPGSLHLLKDNGANGNALKVWVFGSAGAPLGEIEVAATAYAWSANTWVRLRLTWDFTVAPGARNVRVYVNGAEAAVVGATTGPASMPAPSPGNHVYIGNRSTTAPHANGVLDEVTIYDAPLPPS